MGLRYISEVLYRLSIVVCRWSIDIRKRLAGGISMGDGRGGLEALSSRHKAVVPIV